MPQTLEEFSRGTPFAREVDRLRAIESNVIVLLVALDQGEHERVAEEALAQLREYLGRPALCPMCKAKCYRVVDGARAWSVCTAGCGFSAPIEAAP
jgi:Uma2 family endonuclease